MKRTTFNRIARAVTSVHILAYRVTGGRIGGTIVDMPVLLLTTTGRRSGRARTVPLTYLTEGDHILLAGSVGGNPWFPGWWLNLQANPQARIRLGGRTVAVVAREASPEERERLWPRFTAAYQGYAGYQSRTTRRIPVAILTPSP